MTTIRLGTGPLVIRTMLLILQCDILPPLRGRSCHETAHPLKTFCKASVDALVCSHTAYCYMGMNRRAGRKCNEKHMNDKDGYNGKKQLSSSCGKSYLYISSAHPSTGGNERYAPSVSRALPPVGWQRIVSQPWQVTTVCACEKTVEIR